METQKQNHITKMIEIENKKRKIAKNTPASLEDIEAQKTDEFLKGEEEKSRILYNQMVSDVATSNIQLPPSFLKVQKNNESKDNI